MSSRCTSPRFGARPRAAHGASGPGTWIGELVRCLGRLVGRRPHEVPREEIRQPGLVALQSKPPGYKFAQFRWIGPYSLRGGGRKDPRTRRTRDHRRGEWRRTRRRPRRHARRRARCQSLAARSPHHQLRNGRRFVLRRQVRINAASYSDRCGPTALAPCSSRRPSARVVTRSDGGNRESGSSRAWLRARVGPTRS